MSKIRALVTGGAGAIGSAISRTLAGDDLEVLIHGSGQNQRAEQLAQEIRDDGNHASAVYFDLKDPLACENALGKILSDGPIQVLVHNAGIHLDAPMAGMNNDQWRSVLAVSLDGFYHVTQPLLLPMLRCRWGRIISLSSLSAVMGNRGQVNYAAAKAGLHGATKSLAKECASRGVTVNAVAPGVIDTPETLAAIPKERLQELVPMKRAGDPQEVADLVSFLASEKAGYITGQIISIDGGVS
ncbi:MAG: 3-oxoacyl-ACP reductase FabG [Pseudomonadota bacterium]